MATERLYRSNYGEIFGVCKGIAQWRDLPVGGVRLVFILIAVFTAIVPCLLVYCVLGIFIPANPNEKPSKSDENGDWNNYKRREKRSYSSSKAEYGTYENVSDDDDEQLRRKYEDLKKKVEDMEASVLDKENDWDARFSQSDSGDAK